MKPVHVLKRLLLSLLLGALTGNIIAMVMAPRALTWFQTPGTGAALCNCADVAQQTAQSLIKTQLIGMGIGAVAGVALGELLAGLWRGRRQRQAADMSPNAPASSPGEPPASV